MKLHRSLLAVIFLLPLSTIAQNWQWAKQVGSNIVQSYDGATVISDGNNYYLIGWYSGSLFLQTDSLYSYGTNDLFVIKYDASGNELWSRGFGGNGNISQSREHVFGAYDSVNNCIYLAGEYAGTMILGNDTLNSFPNDKALFICKISLNGTFIWAKAINSVNYHIYGFNGYAEVYSSPTGIIYLTATMPDTITICGNTILPGGFLVKYDSNGNCLYSRNLFSTLYNRVRLNFIADDMIMSGSFQDSSFNLDTAILANNGLGNYDFYISRADTNGNVKWIKHVGYSGSDALGSVDINYSTSEIYFCGGFQDSININGSVYYNTGKDILFGKMDSLGNSIWTKQCHGLNNVGGANNLKVDGEGNFYSVGYFSGTATFGNYTVNTSNTYDMFLTRYDSSGVCLGIRHFGYAGGGRVVVDNTGNPICTGGFQNTVSIGNNTFTSYGYVDIYLAKSDIFTGIGEGGRMTNNQLIIYANPNQGKCHITVPEDFINEQNLILSIFDNSGKLIQQKVLEMAGDKIKLNLEAEAKGIYNVTLSNKEKSYSGKIVFQ